MKYLLFFILLTNNLYAQTAKVVELSPEDAKLAKSLYQQKSEIEAKITALNKRVTEFSKFEAFEYSTDFRFVVPAQNFNSCISITTDSALPHTCGTTTSPYYCSSSGCGTTTSPYYCSSPGCVTTLPYYSGCVTTTSPYLINSGIILSY